MGRGAGGGSRGGKSGGLGLGRIPVSKIEIESLPEDIQDEINTAIKNAVADLDGIDIDYIGTNYDWDGNPQDAKSIAIASDDGRSLYLNPSFWNDRQTLIESQAKLQRRWDNTYFVDSSVKGMVTHEIGHILTNQNTATAKRLRDWANSVYEGDIWSEYRRTGERFIKNPRISNYARTSPREFLAEVYTAYKNGKKDPYIDIFVDILKGKK